MRLIKELPDPFLMQNGKRVMDAQDWRHRREEIATMMLSIQYGTMPGRPEETKVEVREIKTLDDGYVREDLRLTFIPETATPESRFSTDVTVWRPSNEVVTQKQQTIEGFGQSGLPLLVYVGMGVFRNLLDSGYMMLCYDNSQLDPMEEGQAIVGPAQKAYEELDPRRYSWGSIAVWAWGASRMLDYALTLSEVNPDQIMISGHSRNGKTALLAGALDERFALVNPAGSGCAGAGSYLALGADCEDLAALTDRERWWAWTHPDFETWAGREAELPFDQHFLMGLVAPRPLLRTEGTMDHWANPEGTCASFLATEPIYDFLGVPARNGIYFHEGGHHQGEEDVDALISFANWHFFGVEPRCHFKDLPYGASAFPRLFRWSHPGHRDTPHALSRTEY